MARYYSTPNIDNNVYDSDLGIEISYKHPAEVGDDVILSDIFIRRVRYGAIVSITKAVFDARRAKYPLIVPKTTETITVTETTKVTSGGGSTTPKEGGDTTEETPTVGGGKPIGVETVQLPFTELPIDKQVAIMFVVTQSNGENGAIIPASARKDGTFFTHVKTLNFNNINNNVNNEAEWKWFPFTTLFEYNLGRRTGGHIYCMATSIALKWQERINAGAKLPKLYIVQVSHSSFGFAMNEVSTQPANVTGLYYRPELAGFNPLFGENPQPIYQDVPIERLWKFIPRVHKWALNNLDSYNVKIRHLGVVWNQWEHDVAESSTDPYKQYLTSFLKQAFDDIVGAQVPLYYMYPRAPYATNPPHPEKARRFKLIKQYFDEIEKERANVSHFDVKKLSIYNPNTPLFGVFVDNFHYISSMYKDFVAQDFMNHIEGINGVDPSKKNNGLLVNTILKDAVVKGSSTEAVQDWYANQYPLSNEAIIPGWLASGTATYTLAVIRSGGRRVFAFPKYAQSNAATKLYTLSSLPLDTKYFYVDLTMVKGSRFGMGIMMQGQNNSASFANYGKHFVYLGLSLDDQDGQYGGAPRLKVWRITSSASAVSNTATTAKPNYTSATGFEKDTILRFKKYLDGANTKIEVLYSIDNGTSFTSMVSTVVDASTATFNGGVGALGLALGLALPASSGIGQAIKISSIVSKSLE